MTARSVQAITFDFWDTLVRSDTTAFRVARRLAIGEVFADHGFSAEHDAIEAAFDHAVGLFDSAWSTNEQFTGHHAIEAVLDMLGHSPPAEVRQRIIASGGMLLDSSTPSQAHGCVVQHGGIHRADSHPTGCAAWGGSCIGIRRAALRVRLATTPTSCFPRDGGRRTGPEA